MEATKEQVAGLGEIQHAVGAIHQVADRTEDIGEQAESYTEELKIRGVGRGHRREAYSRQSMLQVGK